MSHRSQDTAPEVRKYVRACVRPDRWRTMGTLQACNYLIVNSAPPFSLRARFHAKRESLARTPQLESRVSRKEHSTIRKYGASRSFFFLFLYLLSIVQVCWINERLSRSHLKRCIAKRTALTRTAVSLHIKETDERDAFVEWTPCRELVCHANAVKRRENIADWNHLRVTGFAGINDTSTPMAMNGPIQASDFHVGSTTQERNIYIS